VPAVSENGPAQACGAAELPGLDCGVCGFPTCAAFSAHLERHPQERVRCIHLTEAACGACTAPCAPARPVDRGDVGPSIATRGWLDSLGREVDFVLDTFASEPGPREIILPHNPALVAELQITPGDILIGRPMGMSCGCPITHCGVATGVDARNGVVVWCVTGPLGPRAGEHKDLGYYTALGYEGLVRETRSKLEIGRRYWFLPRRCMLQWRHSGLVNFMNRRANGAQVRIEGLYIG
jgi:uncharacterized Fe-S cluster-containing protein